MRFFESNHRYLMYSAGFHYIVEFNTRTFKDRNLYVNMAEALKNMYGPDKDTVEMENAKGEKYRCWRGNDNWRTEYRPSLKRKRIYLKDESAYTMVMLRMS